MTRYYSDDKPQVRAAKASGEARRRAAELRKRDAQRQDPVRRRWWMDYSNTGDAIPKTWLVHGEDGFTGIHPDHANEEIVQLYRKLAQVGYAKGWL